MILPLMVVGFLGNLILWGADDWQMHLLGAILVPVVYTYVGPLLKVMYCNYRKVEYRD